MRKSDFLARAIDDRGHHEKQVDYHVPIHVYRMVHHYYNLIHVKEYWDSLGVPPPDWVMEELRRIDTEAREVIIEEKGQGGALDRHEPPKEKSHDTPRPRRQEHERRA